MELAATIPSNIKFKDGNMKHVLKSCMRSVLPESIVNRMDKMGFPVPLQEWVSEQGIVREFVTDILSSQNAKGRALIDNPRVLDGVGREALRGRPESGGGSAAARREPRARETAVRRIRQIQRQRRL